MPIDPAIIGTAMPPHTVGVERGRLRFFARATGQADPIYSDVDAAREVGIDDVFAHGMLSMAYVGRLLTDHVPQERIRSFRVRFTAITPVGAEPTCTAIVTRAEHGVAELDLTAALPDDTVTVRGTAVVTYPTSPA